MDMVSVAERVAAIERSSVTLDAQRCTHASDRFSTCQACQGVCPVAAIVPGRPPTLDSETCVNCLACLPLCPTGAFGADDAVPALLECAARLDAGPLELVCQPHPRAELGLSAAHTAIRVRGCLAGLGVGALVALAVLDVAQVTLRADACPECAWGALLPHVLANAAQAQRLLEPWDRAARLAVTTEPSSTSVSRRVLDAANPPLSRRELFRMAARRGQVLLARAVNETGGTTGPHPARERQRVLNALAALPARAAPAPAGLAAGPGYALLSASEACSACRACVRACAAGALQWEDVEPSGYRLLFQPQRCHGCEACLHVCAPAALSLEREPSFEAVFADPAPRVLSEGGLVRCARCNSWTAAKPGQTLCPTCQFRRNHPFGARSIPGLAKVQS